jgi:hypothetical protein
MGDGIFNYAFKINGFTHHFDICLAAEHFTQTNPQRMIR